MSPRWLTRPVVVRAIVILAVLAVMAAIVTMAALFEYERTPAPSVSTPPHLG
ncbi:hypothetical protein [Mycobacterium sp.]|uniref:hypothetical protein n=1 Tax=Mycobacterium sp. TaxID=1785 RepID=UPI0025E0B830|nr:hypothetical protein [Mycobacterium sp.]